MNRREALNSVAVALAASGFMPESTNSAATAAIARGSRGNRPAHSAYIETGDGARLFYQDCGAGKSILFIHGLCLSSQIWQYVTLPLSDQGFRCIAYDRRGHGRSTHPGSGYDYDNLADDLACVIDQLDLRALTLVGHSMGAGEIVRYLSRHGADRLARIALIAPALPFGLKTPNNPEAVDRGLQEQVLAAWYKDYPQWIADNTPPFFMPETSDAQMRWGSTLAMQVSLKAAVACYHAVTETDFRREVARISLPTLIIQGDKDVSCQIDFTGRKTAELIKSSKLKVYPGAPHGLIVTHAEQLNKDLASFAIT